LRNKSRYRSRKSDGSHEGRGDNESTSPTCSVTSAWLGWLAFGNAERRFGPTPPNYSGGESRNRAAYARLTDKVWLILLEISMKNG